MAAPFPPRMTKSGICLSAKQTASSVSFSNRWRRVCVWRWRLPVTRHSTTAIAGWYTPAIQYQTKQFGTPYLWNNRYHSPILHQWMEQDVIFGEIYIYPWMIRFDFLTSSTLCSAEVLNSFVNQCRKMTAELNEQSTSTRSMVMIATVGSLLPLTSLVVALRFYTRRCLLGSLGVDDWVTLTALVC